MKNFGSRNFRKQRDINNGEKYITLYIYLNSGIIDKIKITPSEKKDYLGRSGKGLITYLGLKTTRSPKKIKKAVDCHY